MNIVAIDDEEGALKLLTKAIKKVAPNDNLIAFSQPSAVLEFAKNNPVDVLFSDIHMRGQSGIELAEKVKKLHPSVNIIFTTGHSEHAIEALKLHSSGYLLKPITARDVKTELENLRIIPKKESKIKVKTFGYFDIFVDSKPITFRREKAKEFLAVLIDRKGSSVSRKEIAAVIFEDSEYSRSVQAYLTQIVKSLREALESANISDILLSDYNSYAVDISKFTCDSYAEDAKNKFAGEYMTQYSWAEERIFEFINS